MLVKTQGLVLRTVKYSDSSLITTILTKELGIRSYLQRGVRSNKKSKGNICQPLQFLQLVVSERENKNLQFIKEFDADIVYKSIPYDVRKSAIALFMLEAIIASVKEKESNPELYEFVKNSFLELDQKQSFFFNDHLQFLMRLASMLGFQPMNNFSDTKERFALQDGFFVSANEHYPSLLSKEESWLFHQFIKMPAMQLSKLQRQQLLVILEQYYQYQLIDFKKFKTPAVFEGVFG